MMFKTKLTQPALLLAAVVLSQGSFTQVIEYSKGIYNFFENKGQWPDGVLYKTDVVGGKIWLEQGRVLYHWQDFSAMRHAHDHPVEPIADDIEGKQSLVLANFSGCNTSVKTEKLYPTSYYQNYFLGNDKSKWASGVRGYNHVKYLDLYDGIDLLFFEKDNQLKYEFQISPGSNPSDIRIQYEGHSDIKVSQAGDLTISSPLGAIIEKKPYAYQIKNGKMVEIICSFNVLDDKVSFTVGKYDPSLELVIDPYLVFATYSGSPSDNFGMTATYAYDGKGYSGGTIYGPNYPCPDPSAWNCTSNLTIDVGGSATTDVFISKYKEDGTVMLWTNFIGGGDNTQGTETVHSLICDTLNNVYLYGMTSSLDFPLSATPYQAAHAGGEIYNNNSQGVLCGATGTDIYVSKFSSDGTTLMGSTYVGGSKNDGLNYRPSAVPYSSAANYDSLVSNYGDQCRGEIMLDTNNNILIASSTRSLDFPIVNGFQPVIGGQQDAVVFKLSADFSTLLWSTYYGGSKNDAGFSVKIDSSYNVLLGGGTSSLDLPGTAGGFQAVYNGGPSDGYICKISSDGTTHIQSTYVGTNSYDNLFFVEGDRWDNIYCVGQSEGSMPVSAAYSNPGSSQFIWKLLPDLSATEYTTVFGSGDGDVDISPAAFLVDVCGNVYVSGWGGNLLAGGTPIDNMPTFPVVGETPPNGFDFYLFVLENDGTDILLGTYLGGASAKEHVDGGTSRFDKNGVVYQSVCGGCWGLSDFPTTPGAWSAINPTTTFCNNILFKYDTEIVPQALFELDTLEGCAPLNIVITNESTEFDSLTWSFGAGVTIITPGTDPEILITVPGVYTVILTIFDTICNLSDTAMKVINVYPPLELYVPNDTVVCGTPGSWVLTANTNGSASEVTWGSDLTFSPPLNIPGTDSMITISPTTSQTYYVTATNGWPLCDLTDSVVVLFVEDALIIIPDTVMCYGDTITLWALSSNPFITLDFNWAPDPFLIIESGGFAMTSPDSSMWFYCTATYAGCTITDSVWVTVDGFDPLTVYATADPMNVPEYGTTTLSAFPIGPYNYEWNPKAGVTDPYAQTTTAEVIVQTTYEVTITDGPCQYKTPVTVGVLEFICGSIYIFVPSAFSPNNDNLNDVLYVRGQNIEELTFKVFDRWGELVFETTDQSVGWDGFFKGKVVDPDVYVYHLHVLCADDQEELIKGNVTVLK